MVLISFRKSLIREKKFSLTSSFTTSQYHGQSVGKFVGPSNRNADPACIGWIRSFGERCSKFAVKTMPDTLLLAVTVLTSMDQEILSSIGVSSSVEKQVDRLASLASAAGIGGLVYTPRLNLPGCAHGYRTRSNSLPPGIRPSGSDIGDQRRIMTPGEAVRAGADYLVIGRPILSHEEPAVALAEIQDELNQAGNR